MKNRYEIDWKAYAAKAAQAAAEGAVLLKNDDHALPLREGMKLAVFGRIQFDYYKSGTGSGGMINTRYVVGILDALKEENLELDREVEQIYLDWIAEHPFDQGSGWAQEPWSQQEMPVSREMVEKAANKNDAALVIIGRTAGEDRDAKNEKGSYSLSEGEEEMLEKVCGAFQRVIVLLNVGNIIDMRWVGTYDPQAVLYVWQGGMEGGHAAADVLMGRMNPCGKLADTITLSIEDYPSAPNFGGPEGNRYEEDIYVGYRYFETFDSAKKKVLYPFGFGLSYTSFEIKSRMEKKAEGCLFHVKVKNTGNLPGKEVVQIYAEAPQGKLGKPARVLAAFAKTKCLDPGEEQELELVVKKASIASYDDSGVTGHKSCYVLEAGTYRFYAGADVRSAVLAGCMEVRELEVLEQCTEAMAPVEHFMRMKPVQEQCGEALSSGEELVQERCGEAVSSGEEPMQEQCGEEVPSGEERVQEQCGEAVPSGEEPAQRQYGGLVTAWEETPLRTYSMARRSREEEKTDIPYTGNKEYKLSDVYDKRITMEAFLAQLSDEELCCIVRGEGMCSSKVTPGTAAAFGGVTRSLESYGIPCGCCADGPSGIRMDCGTYAFSLPNGTCLACSFNEELVEELYTLEGAELRKNHIDILLGPGMNIHRNPLNGRNFEYFSEDPLLTGKMAAAQLRGMGKYQVTGAMKHFAANNQEFNRKKYNAVVSERALREIYLKGFEIAVKEGGGFTVMTTYGAVNGLWTAGNYDLLTTILRKEWGFDGLVMTDWWADINDEGEEPSMQNTAAMVRSQNDVYMVVQDAEKNSGGDNLEESLKNGTLLRADLIKCAGNILRVLMRLPVMDRSLGRISREELEAAEAMAKEDGTELDIPWYVLDDRLELEGKGIDTRMGKSFVCGIQTDENRQYKIGLKVKVDAADIAQVPVSIFVNGTLQKTFTLNGTDGKFVEIGLSSGGFTNSHNYLKLYFAQSGMQIDKVWVERAD